MNKVIVLQLTGFAVTVIGGVFLHYLYDLAGKNKIAALFSGVNESTWEHIKLLYFPVFFYSLVQNRLMTDVAGFWCIRLVGLLTGFVLIPVLFYTINGVFGKTPDFINIAIFFVSAAAVFISEKYLWNINAFPFCNGVAAFTVICVIGILFFVFTFKTPKIPLFRDPITGKYGL